MILLPFGLVDRSSQPNAAVEKSKPEAEGLRGDISVEHMEETLPCPHS